jgi:hypothetical protein
MTVLAYRYWLKDDQGTEREVTMQEWVAAEHAAGHGNKFAYNMPAHGWWSSTTARRDDAVSGRIEYILPQGGATMTEPGKVTLK